MYKEEIVGVPLHELAFARVSVCIVRDKNQEREREMTI